MTQPTALFLADVIDSDAASAAHHGAAAYELRRLHEEVERLTRERDALLAEPDHETRAELAEQQVVQLAEERDHYRGLWQKAQQAEPVQEPVAWMVYTLDGKSVCVTDNPADFTDEHKALPLYATPQPETAQREPVAWRTFDGEGGYDYRTYDENENYAEEWAKRNPRRVGWVEPLYTARPSARR